MLETNGYQIFWAVTAYEIKEIIDSRPFAGIDAHKPLTDPLYRLD
jgi:hypothetical protein